MPLVAAYACGFAAILLNTQCGLSSLVLAMAAAFGAKAMLGRCRRWPRILLRDLIDRMRGRRPGDVASRRQG